MNQPAREEKIKKKKQEDQNCGCKVFISVWAFATSDLCAIKNVFSGNTFPRPPLFSPVSLCSAFISLNAISASLCQLTLFHWRGVCFTVSIPLCSACLSFHFVSRSLLCFSLKHRRKKEILARNRDRRAPADFLTHSSSLKSKPTEAKSGYYLSCISSFSHSPILPDLVKVYEIL